MKSLAFRLWAGLCLYAVFATPTGAQDGVLRKVLERSDGSWKTEASLEPGPAAPRGAEIKALVVMRFHAGRATGAPMAMSKVSGPSARTEI